MKTYIPNPLDTEHIVLPEALNELTEQMMFYGFRKECSEGCFCRFSKQ